MTVVPRTRETFRGVGGRFTGLRYFSGHLSYQSILSLSLPPFVTQNSYSRPGHN